MFYRRKDLQPTERDRLRRIIPIPEKKHDKIKIRCLGEPRYENLKKIKQSLRKKAAKFMSKPVRVVNIQLCEKSGKILPTKLSLDFPQKSQASKIAMFASSRLDL